MVVVVDTVDPVVLGVAVVVATAEVMVVSDRRKSKNCQYTPTGSPAVNPTQSIPKVIEIAKVLLTMTLIYGFDGPKFESRVRGFAKMRSILNISLNRRMRYQRRMAL